MTTPAIILVNPQMGENIGAVARAMMNFGLRELRLVKPRDGWPNAAAEAMAAHGVEIIHNAKLYETTREAIADLHYVYASTARDRRLNKPQLTPREAVADAASRIGQGQKTGILFGPERTGLVNEDIALAQAILTVPTDPDHASLNIAQCSVVVAYEWFCVSMNAEHKVRPADRTSPGRGEAASLCEAQDAPQRGETILPAKQEGINQFFDHLEAALDKTYYFKLEEKKPRMWRNLRATFLRAALSSQEVHTLRGMITALEKGDKRK